VARADPTPDDGWIAAARAAFPGVSVPDDVFRAYVEARRRDGGPKPEHAASLYLACACTRGDKAAVRAFESQFIPEVKRALGRLRLSNEELEEVVQRLRSQLLVGEGDVPPRIASYTGEGDLRGFLRVTAVRSALKLKRGDKLVADPDAALEVASARDDPELSYMKELYRESFRASFRAALDGLGDRDKNLLRQHFVDGLGIDALGRMYGVHRATAARWVQAAREELLAATRREFAARTRASKRECDSLLRMVQSRFDVTLRRLIG
jgi:RNA polymerase sigma-70 factor (ECF subfamily)